MEFQNEFSEKYTDADLSKPIFENGELVYDLPTLSEIAAYAQKELNSFWDEYRRLTRPHRYKVDLSAKLYELKHSLLVKRR